MTTLPTMARTLLAGALIALAGPAWAADPPAPHAGDAHPAAPAHAEDDAHGADAGAHGEDHAGAHHYDYAADSDHDGVPNWRDPTDGSADNDHYVLGDLFWHAFNLSLLLGLLAYVVRRPVQDAIRNRAAHIRRELTDAARTRDEACQRHQELGARLARFEEEVEELRERARRDADDERERLIERAHVEAERIAQTAQRNIRDELLRAKVALRKEAVELAVQLAEQTLRQQVQSDDHRRLARQFLDSIEDAGGDAHG